MAKDFVNITDTFNLVSHSTHKGGHTWSSFMFFSQLVMQCSLIMFLCYLKFLFPVPQFFLNMFDCLCFSYLCLYHSWTALSCSLWAPVYPLYCFTTSSQIQPLPAASGHLHSTPALCMRVLGRGWADTSCCLANGHWHHAPHPPSPLWGCRLARSGVWWAALLLRRLG